MCYINNGQRNVEVDVLNVKIDDLMLRDMLVKAYIYAVLSYVN